MGIFSRFESKVEDTVEGAANSLASAPISPVQISRRCERQMVRNKMLGTGKQYAPTLYTVLVNPDDDSKLCTFYPTLAGEIETYLRAKAGSAGLYMDGAPLVRFIVDDKLKHGKFDVIAEVVASSIIYQLREEEMKHYGLVQAELAQANAKAIAQEEAQAATHARTQEKAGAGAGVVSGVGANMGAGDISAPYGEQTFGEYDGAGVASGAEAVGAQYGGASDMQFSADDPYAPHMNPDDPYAPSTPGSDWNGGVGGINVAVAGDMGAGIVGAGANAGNACAPNGASGAGASANSGATNASANLISSDGTQRIELHSNKMVAGRASECDIVIPDINASRKHAEFSKDIAGRWVIRDLGSKNGTLVNGEFIQQPTVLYESDTITLGLTNYRYTQR